MRTVKEIITDIACARKNTTWDELYLTVFSLTEVLGLTGQNFAKVLEITNKFPESAANLLTSGLSNYFLEFSEEIRNSDPELRLNDIGVNPLNPDFAYIFELATEVLGKEATQTINHKRCTCSLCDAAFDNAAEELSLS